MKPIVVARTVRAPVETVFGVIADIEKLPESNPDVVKIEFLTEQRTGAGTRFKETRESKGRQMVTELELTEMTPNRRARFVSDMGGTIWDTVFSFSSAGGDSTELEIRLDARPHKLLPKLIGRFVRPMVHKGMEKHIDSVRAYCEGLPKPAM